MSNVIVSFPNPTGLGIRTQTVKTTPSTSLTQVISEVANKNNLGDPLGFALKHKKTILDSSLSMRFANLAPGTKLELVAKVTNSKVSNKLVAVAVQLDGGQRVVDSFPILTTLWNIMLQFEAKHLSDTSQSFLEKVSSDGKWITPVCLILNREFSGFDQLNSISLQSLGLNSGNVVMRVSFKPSSVDFSEVIPLIQESRKSISLDSLKKEDPLPVVPQNEIKIEQSVPNEIENQNDHAPVSNSIQTQPEELPLTRDIQVFSAPVTEVSLSTQIDLPDSYFELSSTELKIAVSNQQARTRKIIEGGPLKTKAMIEKEAKKRMEKHPTTLIRVRFPDATQLQAKFQSSEPFIRLIEVVRESLNDSTRSFTLSQAPPYRRLDTEFDKTFYDLDLFPTAQIHLQFEGPSKEGTGLVDSLLEKAKVLPLPEIPKVESDIPQTTDTLTNHSTELPSTQQSSQGVSSPTKSKLPKWLKLKKP